MTADLSNSVLGAQKETLAVAAMRQLLARIDSGRYQPGDKLPSQEELCREFDVSRTVIREAVASLRLSGHLVVRQGAGVFVAQERPAEPEFGSIAARDVTTAIQILELRLGVETEQVALAAVRRTPDSLAAIVGAFDRFNRLDGSDPEAMAQADYDFHLALAQATNNPQFSRFLKALGTEIFLDLKLKHASTTTLSAQDRVSRVGREHAAILSAISTGDIEGAREAMRMHLEEGLARYRRAAFADESSGLDRAP